MEQYRRSNAIEYSLGKWLHCLF